MKYIRTSRGAVTIQLISTDGEVLSSLNRLRAGSRRGISEEVMKVQFPQQDMFNYLPSVYTANVHRSPKSTESETYVNPLNAELNPICHLLALVGTHHILHVSGVRVNSHCVYL